MQAIDAKTQFNYASIQDAENDYRISFIWQIPSYLSNMQAIQNNFTLTAKQNADLKVQIEALNLQNEQLKAAIAQNNAQNVEMKAALNETSAGLNDVRQKITTLSERIGAMVTAIPAAVRTLTRNIISVYAAIRAGSIDTLELDMGNADALEHIA